MTYYNLSFISNTTGISTLWVGVNDNSGGWFIGLFVITLWLLLMMVFMSNGYNIKETLLGSSFIISIVGGLLWAADLFPDYGIGVVVAVLAISLFMKLTGDG